MEHMPLSCSPVVSDSELYVEMGVESREVF